MLTYQEAKEMMRRARNGRRKLENNTYLEARPDQAAIEEIERGLPVSYSSVLKAKLPDYAVRLHDTDVVTLHSDGSYTLNSGGWRTVTTKARINVYVKGWNVYSDRGSWYVSQALGGPYDGETWPNGREVARYTFADGMRVFPDGRVEGAGRDETAIRNALLKEIRAYVDGFARHVAKHGLADPSGGDCWGCFMVPGKPNTARPGTGWEARQQEGETKLQAGPPGADHVMGVEHIFEHFRERYYVPSLVWRAVQRCGNPGWAYTMIQRDAQRTHPDTRFLKRQLRAYFKALMPALMAAKVAKLGRKAA